ncbi:hypothetical protein [Konateibacter massiliensis]|uniref:hypothetical protein n=1 Tax=Konateibacter massiliensis TaxID=2002841 RepID=UPI0015D51AC6|nr:hypothetical protein [Konateibacter massiliensis]
MSRMKPYKRLLGKYGRIFILFCIVVSVLGIIGSYLFPNESFYDIDVNMEENSDFTLPLDKGSVVEYKCNTGTKPMAGIQVWISKEGAEFTDGKIVYEVYNGDGTILLGTGEQPLVDILDKQFVYLPFKGMEECNGDLTIRFSFTGSEDTVPVLLANQTEVEEASTSVDGNAITGNIKSSYIYINYTHPLVFDLKVILAIFVTVFFTLGTKKKQKVNEALWIK